MPIPLNPWPASTAHGQQSLVKVDHSFIRVHRYRAPGPGAARNNPDRSGDGRVTFVLVHGIGLNSAYLGPLAEELSTAGEVMVIDLPGFGDLPRPKATYSIKAFATAMKRAMELYGVRDPILVGHSMGAQIVVELMASYGYRRATLVGPPVNARERSGPIAVFRYLQSALYEKPNLALMAVKSYFEAITSWVLEVLPAMMDYPIEQRITELDADAQVAFVRGQHDYLAPPDWIDQLRGAVARSSNYTIAGAAHSTVFNDDDAVARAARSLLTKAERARLSGDHGVPSC